MLWLGGGRVDRAIGNYTVRRDFDPERHSANPAINRAIRERSNELAAERDRYARRLLEKKLPRPLHWLIDWPKLLMRVLRVMPRWRMQMTVVDLRGGDLLMVTTAEGAKAVARAWVAEAKASGCRVPDSGLIFLYTDVTGLPAELHGVE
jgi:hypothetical protein